MAGQINPIIAVFMQAQQRAEETARGIAQQNLLKQRLQIEEDANIAEAQWRQGQLEATAAKAKQEADEFKQRMALDEQKGQVDVLRFLESAVKNNTINQQGLDTATKSFKVDPTYATGFKSALDRYAEEREAKVAQEQAMTPELVSRAGQIAGAQSNATIQDRLKIVEAQGNLQKELRDMANTAAYKRALDVAAIRARATNDPNKKKEIFDNMPASPTELEHFKNPITGQVPPYGTTHKELYGLAANKPLTQGQVSQITDLQEAEQMFLDLNEYLNTKEAGNYFQGPLTGGFRSLIKKRTTGLSGTEAKAEAKLGNILTRIGHPLFGASFTRGEKDILTTFVPDPSGNIKLEDAKAKVKEALEFIGTQRGIVYGALTSNTGKTGAKSPQDGEEFEVSGKRYKIVNGRAREITGAK